MTSPIFLSYCHHDSAAAQDLHAQLLKAGMAVFKDDRNLRSGDRWLQALQQALADRSAFIVLVGRDGAQRWVGAEVEVALNRHLSARDGASKLPIHPVFLGDAAPDALPPFLALFQAERWLPGQALPAAMLDALRQGQQRLGQAALFNGCPYLGLGSFQPGDAHLFFGRRAETLQALAGLGDQQQTAPDQLQGGSNGSGYHRWLQIEGNSGSGKSSLVLAGLLPMVERGALWPRTGLAQWQVLGPMMPGQAPVLRLAEALEKGLKPDGQRDTLARAQRLASNPPALALDIRDAARPDTGWLLVIDQFEELFTLAAEPQRREFDALLAGALADADCPLFVVSTVRDVLRQQLAIQVGRWQRGGRWTRWFHLAGFGQLLDFRRLRPLRQSVEGRFLARSKRFAAAQAVLLMVLAGGGLQAGWSTLENLSAKVGNSVVYLAVLPFWYADALLLVPETVALPALPAGQTFELGCKPAGDDRDGKCSDSEPLKAVAMPSPCAMGKFEVTNWQFNRFAWERNGKGMTPLAGYPASGISICNGWPPRPARPGGCRPRPSGNTRPGGVERALPVGG